MESRKGEVDYIKYMVLGCVSMNDGGTGWEEGLK